MKVAVFAVRFYLINLVITEDKWLLWSQACRG